MSQCVGFIKVKCKILYCEKRWHMLAIMTVTLLFHHLTMFVLPNICRYLYIAKENANAAINKSRI